MHDFVSKRAAFRKLHEAGCFVMPNPWDAGSAIYLATLGFEAIATTSAGFGFSKGLPDSPLALKRDLVLTHVAELSSATALPLNVDYQSGYANTPEGVAESVAMCVQAGASGLSIEDATGDPSEPLYEIPEALERLQAAREAIDKSGSGVLLTARAEPFLVGHPDAREESARRIAAYAPYADVLFAPAPATRENIAATVAAAGGKPVNAIVFGNTGLSVADVGSLGVRRISVGSALSRAAWSGFMAAVRPLAEEGSFRGLEGLASFEELNELFGKRAAQGN